MNLYGVLGSTAADGAFDTAYQIRGDTPEEAERIAREHGRCAHVEVSAKLLEGVPGQAGGHFVGAWPTSPQASGGAPTHG